MKKLIFMKKKHIFIALIISLFAAGSIINMHLAENHQNMDVSLEDITVMAQAEGETGTNCINCYVSWEYCPDGTQVIRCRLGGDGCFVGWQELC